MEKENSTNQINILEVLGRKEVELQALKQKVQQLHQQIEQLEKDKLTNGNIINEKTG